MDDLLDLRAIAALAEVSVGSMRTYHAVSAQAREAGDDVATLGTRASLPAPDFRFGRTPVWRLSTVQPWLDARAAAPAD